MNSSNPEKSCSLSCIWFARALLTSSLLLAALPVLAEGTAAGSSIRNRATAQFNYINSSGINVLNNATSNEIVIEVAEVAGIVVNAKSPNDGGDNVFVPDEIVNYDFTVTNVGNDPTKFFLPDSVTIAGPGTLDSIAADLDGDGTFETPISGAGFETDLTAVSDSVDVRIAVSIDSNAAAGSTIEVQYGDTGPNDNTATTQNQPDTADGSNANEVRTVDGTDGDADETNGLPANGEREASAVSSITLGTTPQAFAKILKTQSAYSDAGTASLNDDEITYSLELDVDAAVPVGSGLNPANLTPTTITLDSLPAQKVLISNAIPASTQLQSVTAPVGWTAVYSVTPSAIAANDAATLWTTIAPLDLSLVTRVGFIADGPIATATSTPGFSVVLAPSVLPTVQTLTISNLAQVFGKTAGDPTNSLVYDESGDQMASNFNDDGTPGSNTPTSGVADASTQGIDSGNDNTGTGPGGEVNAFTIGSLQILNGPNLHPDAIGPTDNNDDFTNEVAIVPANTAIGSTTNPLPVIFANVLQNPDAGILSNVRLVPVPPANPAEADLPNGTLVTITDVNGGLAKYSYSTGTNSFTPDPLNLPLLGASIGLGLPNAYVVTVDLPDGTPLSTDDTDTEAGFPITVRAYVDTNNNDSYDPGESFNDTVDRVYNGVLLLQKESRILIGDGPAVEAGQELFSTASKTPAPGNLIEYRITYTNISSVQPVGGANNAIIDLTGIIITDDGTQTGISDWGLDNDGDGVIDTSNVVGSATDSSGTAVITYFGGSLGLNATTDIAGLTIDLDVTRYVDTVIDPLAPGESHTFSFQRRLN